MTTPDPDPDDVAPAVAELDTIVSLSKRRGFIFPSSEIYGGINAVWDYGPLGVELKNNVKRAWWRAMVQERDDIVGLDAGILMHPQVWVTSGHVGSFSDPLVECQTDHTRFRLDELPGAEDLTRDRPAGPDIVERLGLRCPDDGGPLSAPRRFNLMFKTFMGPVEEDASVIYLRPETAQGSYVNFKNVQQSSRKKLPFGIAQIGKSFRNEISPGNFVFRMREFEQMEMQYFVRPEAEAAEAFETWLPRRRAWYERYGVTPERLRFREHAPDELAHYAKKAIDVEYRFPFGWKELEGVHNRGDFDLSRHREASGESLEYFDQATEEHVIPWIVETAAGADRAAFTFLIDAYREEEVRGETRVSLALHPDLAPYKVAVLPLLKKRPEIVELCHRIKDDLQAPHDGRLRRHGRDRQALPAPGRDRDAVVRDGRRRLARGRRGHRPRPRLDDPGARAGRGRDAAHPRSPRRGARGVGERPGIGGRGRRARAKVRVTPAAVAGDDRGPGLVCGPLSVDGDDIGGDSEPASTAPPSICDLVLLAVSAAIVVTSVVRTVMRPRRATAVYDPPVLLASSSGDACAGGFYARHGDTIVLTSTGHCTKRGHRRLRRGPRDGPRRLRPGRTRRHVPVSQEEVRIVRPELPRGRRGPHPVGPSERGGPGHGRLRVIPAGTRPLVSDIAIGDRSRSTAATLPSGPVIRRATTSTQRWRLLRA